MTELERRLAQALSTGEEMRRAQRHYFRLRAGLDKVAALKESMALEKRFDVEARAALHNMSQAEETGR